MSVRRVAGVVIPACLALALARLLVSVFSLGAADYGEGPLLVVARRWTLESPDGSWWAEVPFTATAYGPLFPLTWSRLILALPAADPLLLGRLISLGATALVVAVVAAGSRVPRGGWQAAAFAVLAFLSSSVGQRWPAEARVDPLCAALLAAAYWALGSGSRRGIAAAATLVLLATTAKQTAVFHLVGMATWLLVAMSPRTAARVLSKAIVSGIAIWVAILALGGNYFWQAAVIANLNRLSVWQGGTIAYAFLASPLAIGALWVAAESAVRKGTQVLTDRWWVAFATSLLVGGALCFKVGSDTNYFLDAAWSGAILIGRYAGVLTVAHPRRAVAALAAAAALVVPPSVLSMHGRGWRPTEGGPRHTVERLATGHDGPVLADGLLVGFLPASRGTPLVNDPLILRFVGDRAEKVDAELVSVLEGRRGSPLVLLAWPLHVHLARMASGVPWWPEGILRVMAKDFCQAGDEDGVYAYRRCSPLSP